MPTWGSVELDIPAPLISSRGVESLFNGRVLVDDRADGAKRLSRIGRLPDTAAKNDASGTCPHRCIGELKGSDEISAAHRSARDENGSAAI